jgi:hypothetical protein
VVSSDKKIDISIVIIMNQAPGIEMTLLNDIFATSILAVGVATSNG